MYQGDAPNGSLGQVVHLTRNFTSESSLHHDVVEAISAALQAGWADPKKLSQSAARASALKSASLEGLSTFLKTSPAAIEPVGEPALLHQLAIEGYLSEGAHLVTTNLDLGKVRAVAHRYAGPKSALQSDKYGRLAIPKDFFAGRNMTSAGGVLSLQSRNGETGVTQDVSALIQDVPENVRIVLDCTKSIPAPLLPRISAATFEATAWQGPAGIGFLVINDAQKYRYPLPHLAPIRTPGSYSLPLLVGAVVALDRYRSESNSITELRALAIKELSAIESVTVIGDGAESDSRYISIIIDGVIAEEITRELNNLNIAIDAGSACSPDYLAPSHVITSLGFKSEGHLRITLNTNHRIDDIQELAKALVAVMKPAI
jgi:cysteine desulfurase